MLKRPSTAQGGSTGRFTVTLKTHTDTHTYIHKERESRICMFLFLFCLSDIGAQWMGTFDLGGGWFNLAAALF